LVCLDKESNLGKEKEEKKTSTIVGRSRDETKRGKKLKRRFVFLIEINVF
jgi:hypothetical protein